MRLNADGLNAARRKIIAPPLCGIWQCAEQCL